MEPQNEIRSIFFEKAIKRQSCLIFKDGAKLFVSDTVQFLNKYFYGTDSPRHRTFPPNSEVFLTKDVKSEDFLTFLYCILSYPLEKPVDDENFDTVMSMVKIYEVSSLLYRGQQFLEKRIDGLKCGQNINDHLKCALRPCKMEWIDLILKIVPKLSVFSLKMAKFDNAVNLTRALATELASKVYFSDNMLMRSNVNVDNMRQNLRRLNYELLTQLQAILLKKLKQQFQVRDMDMESLWVVAEDAIQKKCYNLRSHSTLQVTSSDLAQLAMEEHANDEENY